MAWRRSAVVTPVRFRLFRQNSDRWATEQQSCPECRSRRRQLQETVPDSRRWAATNESFQRPSRSGSGARAFLRACGSDAMLRVESNRSCGASGGATGGAGAVLVATSGRLRGHRFHRRGWMGRSSPRAPSWGEVALKFCRPSSSRIRSPGTIRAGGATASRAESRTRGLHGVIHAEVARLVGIGEGRP